MEDTGKAAVAEFVTTFALIFVGAGAVILNANGQLDLTGVALAQGLVLAIKVSITAHITGGMVKPAGSGSRNGTHLPRSGCLVPIKCKSSWGSNGNKWENSSFKATRRPRSLLPPLP